MIKITSVRVTPLKDSKNNVKGLATITLNECFVVGGIKVMDSKNGLFINMPNYKSGDEYKDVCFPITAEFREELTKKILSQYNLEI